jgi:phosphatidylglycerol---prolipoprotein diacylglyceryl transferase
MYPILVQIPLPHWTLPLGTTLLALAALGVLLAVFGRRQRALDLVLIGVVAAIAGLIGGFMLRGRTYTLEALPIYSYGVMLCASLVVGWFLTLGLGVRDGLPREVLASCYLVTALAALAGSRILYVLTNLHEFHSPAEILALRRGGLVAYGGFLGGFLGSLAYLRRRGVALLPWADVAVPSLASGLFLTRIGCYLFGCDFGKPLSSAAPAWLRRLGTFPRWPESILDGSGSPAWMQHVAERGLSPVSQASLPVHPTQLYESLLGVALLGLLLWVRRKQLFRGEVFFTFTFAYGFARFALETVRDDAERGAFGPAIADHVYIPVAFLLFALGYAYGPARSIAHVVLRRVTLVLAFVPAAIAYTWLRPPAFAVATAIELSTSQWISLLTALGIAYAWRARAQLAERDPERALALFVPGAEVPAIELGRSVSSALGLAPPKAKKRRRKPRR